MSLYEQVTPSVSRRTACLPCRVSCPWAYLSETSPTRTSHEFIHTDGAEGEATFEGQRAGRAVASKQTHRVVSGD